MENSDYRSGIQLLKRKNPEHPILPTLEKGFSLINLEYLRFALKNAQLYKNKAPENRVEYSDPSLTTLYSNLRTLKNRQAVHSNKFHAASNNNQRAFISDEIMRIQSDIKLTILEINAFKKNGKVHELKNIEQYPVPKDPLKMQRKNENLGSQISRQNRDIRKMQIEIRRNPSNKLEERLTKFKIKLNHLEIHRGHVRNALTVATL